MYQANEIILVKWVHFKSAISRLPSNKCSHCAHACARAHTQIHTHSMFCLRQTCLPSGSAYSQLMISLGHSCWWSSILFCFGLLHGTALIWKCNSDTGAMSLVVSTDEVILTMLTAIGTVYFPIWTVPSKTFPQIMLFKDFATLKLAGHNGIETIVMTNISMWSFPFQSHQFLCCHNKQLSNYVLTGYHIVEELKN